MAEHVISTGGKQWLGVVSEFSVICKRKCAIEAYMFQNSLVRQVLAKLQVLMPDFKGPTMV